ncbi:type VI secretion system protein TssL, long form [Mesorhizobium sp. BAC0120]|uniref:type VI secretion system protein TssL, long form n=1 Tax=Mesorhizobium sp. BAC0120 TaxID=3090670 RepID=UPI00298CD56E|nr:type VI secretion system protein TssL, long form [Mesorhizobium sp. BAC0120]MDW6026578.1 type VI secretion system protein TssL, long form [Mesorhizobium sp. BAC0120]
MSGKGDPFGSGGKTVIMPTPGGGPKRDPFEPLPPLSPQQPQRPSPIFNPSPPQPTYTPQQPDPNDWVYERAPARPMAGPIPQVPQAAPAVDQSHRIPLEVALKATDSVEFSAANPITAAAAPLLILLGRLRLLLVDMQAVPLMGHVAKSITEFEKKVLAAGVPAHEAQVAKYALCGTADDIVQNLPGTDRHVWMQYSMLAQFFGVRTSGVGFFEELNKALANPAPHYNLLELMHACLLLGFEGQYRGAAGGDADLQRVRRDVYQALRHVQARPDEEISPRWRGLALRAGQFDAKVPLWAIASGAGALLVGVFFLLRFLIGNDGEALAQRLVDLHPSASIGITRPEFKKYEPPKVVADTTQLQRIRAALADEIKAGGMAVEPVGDNIVIRVSNLVLFASGKADTKPEFEAAGAKISAALDKEPGPILVTGHTDNVKPKVSSAFKSNYDLSVARAKSVGAVLGKSLTDPSRIQADGKGDLEPVADNKSADGRAQNRRVEIMIPKEETLQAQAGATNG